MSSVTASCGVYRQPSLIESAAAGIGTRLLSWSENRRLIQVGNRTQRAAAIARRERLGELRADALGAAHSGLGPRG